MAHETPQHALTILIVDDEEPIRELLQWMLQDAGYTAYTASDGKQALAFLRAHGPVDVVLSDINMPCMDGMELKRQVHADWPDVPILLTSGRPPPQAIRHFLAKPFRWDALAAAIVSLVERPGLGRCA